MPIYPNNPTEIPIKPKKVPKIIKANLNILKWNCNEKLGIAKEASAVIATIIIDIGLTKFALTAASPKY